MNPVIVLRHLLLALVLTATSQTAVADKGIPWNSLNENERSALRQYHGNWSDIGPAEQRKLHRGARRYLELSPRERQAVEHRRNQYEKMSPGERRQLRKEYRKQKTDR